MIKFPARLKRKYSTAGTSILNSSELQCWAFFSHCVSYLWFLEQAYTSSLCNVECFAIANYAFIHGSHDPWQCYHGQISSSCWPRFPEIGGEHLLLRWLTWLAYRCHSQKQKPNAPREVPGSGLLWPAEVLDGHSTLFHVRHTAPTSLTQTSSNASLKKKK